MSQDKSIKYISDLLSQPQAVTEGDHHSILLYRQTYPYFVPARYLEALELYKHDGFSPSLLSAIRPYFGNWIMFSNYLESGKNPVIKPIVRLVEQNELPVAGPQPETVQPVSLENKVVTDPVQQATLDEPFVPMRHKVTDKKYIIEKAEKVQEKQAAQEIKSPSEAVPQQHIAEHKEEELIQPLYTGDYFRQQGEKVSDELPADIITHPGAQDDLTDEEKSLMVMMSFSDWLLHFKSASTRQQEEERDKKALKTMWQKEKLAAAIEEENEEIPENVFEMAVNSIAKEDGLASESLADIYIKQGKYDQAIEMYRKLSLRYPQKNSYFARKIEEVLKEKQS